MKILTYPNPVLRQKAEMVDDIDDDLRQFIDDMIEAMYMDEGIGLAAPQVGVSKRIIVMDIGQGPIAIINPEIVRRGDEVETVEEGCLSFPGIRLDITRPTEITVRGMSDKGESMEFKVVGLLARVMMHEIDHLEGILFIDHASSIQRRLLRSKLKKLEKVT